MHETTQTLKQCTRCKHEQPITQYEPIKPGNLYKTCIECRNKKNEYKRNHPEQVKLEKYLYRYRQREKQRKIKQTHSC